MKYRYIFLTLCLVHMALCNPVSAQKSVRIDKQLTIITDVLRQLDMAYADTLNYEDLTETAINQMLRRIDPYTVYYPKQKDEELKMMTTGKYGGIGAVIQLQENPAANKKKDKKDTFVMIANPYEGKPAQKNGVLAGDKILTVDGWDARGKTVKEVSDHLRGVPGTTITLRLEREGEKKVIEKSFVRESIHMEPIDYYALIDSVGYIALGEFTEGCANDLQRAAYDLVSQQGARGLIIDLRGNGGGLVDEAISIVGNFVEKGTTVVSVKGKNPKSERTYATTSYPLYPDLPLVILVDKNSASASEIVSGALQDLGRAQLVGQRTFGKGLVQNVRPIAYDGHLKVTTAKYYLPSGRCIQAIDYAERQKGNQLKRDTAGGILPDVVMNDSAKVDVCYSLYVNNRFFHYATRYHRTHPTIAPALEFTLTDEDIEDFCRYLDEENYQYETETGKYFDDLIKMAREEDIDPATLEQLEAIRPALNPAFRDAIARNINEVKEMLGAEIVQRYYYQKGRIAYMLRFDEELEKAIELIHSPQETTHE